MKQVGERTFAACRNIEDMKFQRVVAADKRADMFNTEYAAAYEGALNRVPIRPIASIERGEQVAVIWDTYGKDYWACYVRASKGVRGWALCTSLRMVA